MTPALLGASVGGLILVTNSRTLFDIYGVAGEIRRPVYVAVAAVWILALSVVIRRLRRNGEPLLNREVELATEQTA